MNFSWGDAFSTKSWRKVHLGLYFVAFERTTRSTSDLKWSYFSHDFRSPKACWCLCNVKLETLISSQSSVFQQRCSVRISCGVLTFACECCAKRSTCDSSSPPLPSQSPQPQDCPASAGPAPWGRSCGDWQWDLSVARAWPHAEAAWTNLSSPRRSPVKHGVRTCLWLVISGWRCHVRHMGCAHIVVCCLWMTLSHA